MKAINIKWDVTDGDRDMTQQEMDEILESLPKEVGVPQKLTDEDDISDYLSDLTGFCHDGFELVS